MSKNEKINKKSPLFSLTNRFVLFLLGFILVLFSLYFVGNWQHFLDKNQELLLIAISFTSIFLLLFLLVGSVLIVISVVQTKSVYFVKYIILYILYTVIAVVLFFFSNFLTFLSR